MKQFIAGLILAVAFMSTEASVCVPGIVPNVTLYTNYSLTWKAALNPSSCIINYYVIDILDGETGTQIQLQTVKNVLSYNLVGVLDMCKSYTFEVHALTNESILGPAEKYTRTTAPLSDVNLSLTQLNAKVDVDEVDVFWNLSSLEAKRCVSYYRVVYWDDTLNRKDVYVTNNNFSLIGDVPCMDYSFQVNAIIADTDIEGPVSQIDAVGASKVSNVPSLVTLSTTSNSVNMVWKLEPYSQNHCKLTYLNVYTVGAPSNISTLHYTIANNTVRSNANITLSGLSSDHVYVSNVNVQNSAGVSKNVTVTYQTTDSFSFDFNLNMFW